MGTATTSTVVKDAYYYTVDSKGNIDFPVLAPAIVMNCIIKITQMTTAEIRGTSNRFSFDSTVTVF